MRIRELVETASLSHWTLKRAADRGDFSSSSYRRALLAHVRAYAGKPRVRLCAVMRVPTRQLQGRRTRLFVARSMLGMAGTRGTFGPRHPCRKRASLSLVAEHAADCAQELQRAIGFGDVVIAAGGPCLLLVALHGERAHR